MAHSVLIELPFQYFLEIEWDIDISGFIHYADLNKLIQGKI